MRPKIRCDGESWKFLRTKQGLSFSRVLFSYDWCMYHVCASIRTFESSCCVNWATTDGYHLCIPFTESLNSMLFASSWIFAAGPLLIVLWLCLWSGFWCPWREEGSLLWPSVCILVLSVISSLSRLGQRKYVSVLWDFLTSLMSLSFDTSIKPSRICQLVPLFTS